MKIQEHSLMDPEIQESPFAYYDALLEQAPVYFMPEIGAYVISKYKDIQFVVAHPEIWSMDMRGLPAAQLIKRKAAQEILETEGFPRDTKFTTDPPAHTNYRIAVRNAFSPARVKAQAEFVQATVDELIDGMRGKTECEFMQQFCWWLPMRVITNLLGVPYADADQIKHWSDVWVEPLSYGLTEEREIVVAREEVALQKYLMKHLDEKRRNPGEDVLTDMLNARTREGAPLPLSEIVGLSEHLIVGGHETATSALAAGMAILAQNPDIAAELRADPSQVENFVEEVLRMESPSQGFFRIAVQDYELRGVIIPKGAMVHIRFAAANRDPEQFDEPGKFDLRRPNGRTHLAFSQGVHHCIGSPYARLELYTAFRSLLAAFDDIRLAPGHETLSHIPGLSLRTLKALHLSYRTRSH
ncbi:MAG: cytochrome [Rhodospirillales bacterium]|nr:cytochrome [Rhodospirillales bacterium]